MTSTPTDDIAHLEALVNKLQRNLWTLEGQIADYGGGAVPLNILNARDDTARELAAAKERLENLRQLPGDGRTPYLGLQTFNEDSADLFFGRTAVVNELIERARRSSFLAVLGASGSGKSSVVRAGLIPQLKRGALPGSETWRYSIIKPGDRPLDTFAAELTKLQGGDLTMVLTLSRQLAESERGLLQAADLLLDRTQGQRLMLVVDQCEELWTLMSTAQEQRETWLTQQQPFIRLLLAAVASADSPVLVVLTMRADFLHRAAEHPELARAIGDHDLIVSPMTADELRAAIVEPARSRGASFEPGLVDELIEQVQGRSGALPLLEYTLLELWRHRNGATLTWEAYRQIGGVEGALAARADQILQVRYEPEEREMLRHALLRLVQLGEGVADTRRRLPLSDLTPDGSAIGEIQTLLKPLTDERLLTTGRDGQTGLETVEVTHEALIRAWPTLEIWINEARADLRLQLQLEEAAKEWQASGDNADLLWSGLRLANAKIWQTRAHPRLNERERHFLEASNVAQQTRLDAEERAQREREALLEARAQSAQRLRRRAQYLAGALFAALIAVGAAVYGFAQANDRAVSEARARAQAQQSAQQAEESARLAQLQGLVSAAQVAVGHGQLDKAAALILAAIDKTQGSVPDEATVLIYRVADNGIRRRIIGHANIVRTVAFSPDGKTALSGSWDKTLRLWDLATGQELHIFSGHTDWVVSVKFSPDGKTALSGSYDGTLKLWDVATGMELHTFIGHTAPVTSVAFSPDGKTALSASGDKTLKLWDVATGQDLRTFSGDVTELNSVAFSPDGKTALAGSANKTLNLWDVTSGRKLRTFSGHNGAVFSVAFSPDGKNALSGSDDTTMRLWDVTSGRELHTFIGHTAPVTSVAFSPDGKTALSASGDKTLKLWDIATGQDLLTFSGDSDSVWSAAFSPDGKNILSGSVDRVVRLWDVATSQALLTFSGHTHEVTSVAFSPDGKTALSGANDNTLRLWDVATGQELRTFSGCLTSSLNVAFSPDGKIALSGCYDGTLKLWDVTTGQEVRTFSGHTKAVYSVAFSPDSKTVLSSSDDDTLRLWDVATGQELRTFSGHTEVAFSVAFSPDGKAVLSGTAGDTLKLWDVTTGQELRTFSGHTDAVWSAAFSPDGKTALSGSSDETLRLWDVATGQELRTFSGHTDPVYSVAFSPDGKTVLSGSGDRTLRLWDVATGQELRAFFGHNYSVMSVAFSPDGRTALSGSEDRTMRLWQTDTVADLIAFIRANRYVPELPCAQRALYDVPPLCSDAQPTATAQP